MNSKEVYLIKYASRSFLTDENVPGKNTNRGMHTKNKVPTTFAKHLGKHWPGYGAAALGTYISGKKLIGKKEEPAVKVANMNPLEGGMAEGEPDSHFNKQSLLDGMHVEKEHTIHKSVQKRIAKDHLKEDPKYYKKLKEMEAKK